MTTELRLFDHEHLMRRTLHTSVLCAAAALLLLSGCADLKNPVQNPVAPTPIVHPAGWADPANAGNSNGFHGTYLKYVIQPAWADSSCRSCHGGSFTGGSSTVACMPCHDPYPHEVQFPAWSTSVVRGHVNYLRAHTYPVDACKPCHGDDYLGGTQFQTGVSCATCHHTTAGAPKSPEACNTCHGQFRAAANDTLSWAPPRSTSDDTSYTARGVGAHQLHLRGAGTTSATSVACTGCHTVPNDIFDPGHFVNVQGPAPVHLNIELAAIPSGGGTPSPAYDPGTQKCSSIYCHGAWQLLRSNPLTFDNFYSDSVMTGNFAAPRWNGGPGEATCGTCHDLPPKGHLAASITQCATCHVGVIDASGNIIDKTKHINGKADVFNQEYDFK